MSKGILNAIRNTKVPNPKEILTIPHKIKTETDNTKRNTINIRYFDRHFKKYIKIKGTIEHKTDIPIVYFESPEKLAVILFDDSEYLDEDNNKWIDVSEDYPFSLNLNTELIQFLNVQYYNDFAENKIAKKESGKEGFESYKIPVLLNRIPRTITRININEKMKTADENDDKNKMQITQYLIRQFSKIIMLERVGKKDNSFIITGILLGGSIGIIVGIFLSFSFLR